MLLSFVLAGCAGDDDAGDDGGGDGDGEVGEPNGTGTGSATSWPTGILYRDLTTQRLAAVGSTPRTAELQGGGFDLVAGVLAQGDNRDHILLRPSDGPERSVAVQGAHHVARISLDPHAAFAVVQATEGEGQPSLATNDLNAYRVDLATGQATAIGATADNEESTEWSRDGSRIAFASFSPVNGVNLHILDAATLEETRLIDDAGGLHLSFSRDGSSILESGRLRVYDVETGELRHDLRDEARAGAVAAGYDLEDRFPGQANRGTFPLDGDFSPDGTKLVFDGAVKQGTTSAIIIATMAFDGTGFEVVAGPFVVDPAETNGLNYSEVNPMWT